MKLNELTTDLLQLGTTVDRPIDGDTRGRSLKYIDWENPANNAFHVCKEFDVERTGSSQDASARHCSVRQRHSARRDRMQGAE